MNIIKLKDIVMPSECRLSPFFNKELKGKYAYWIKMRYIFPLDSMDYKTYIRYEQQDPIYFLGADALPHIDMYSEECSMFDFAQVYIDSDATELANAISDYKTANEYVADFDIDINKLRNFRSWLATEILKFNTSSDGTYLDNLTESQMNNSVFNLNEYMDNASTVTYTFKTEDGKYYFYSSTVTNN
jgi:hypothetical protein